MPWRHRRCDPKVDQFAYEKSFLINVGDEKGELFDAAVRRADPRLALELGTYCGYGSLRIARAAPSAEVVSVEHKTHGEYQTLVPDVVLESEYLG
jgi:predicted O-methyltransferase YrrM